MKLLQTFICAFVALVGLVSTKNVNIDGYTKELFTVNLIETKKYTVEGSTCQVDMIYLQGSCAGEYFNGDLIFEDSSTVVKNFKDGRVESVARYYVEGKDNNNNAGRLHFEDIFVGYDDNENAITRPNFITDIESLAWIQTADVVGIMEKTENGRIVRFMWNENGKKPYPVAKYPELNKNYSKKVLTIDVTIPGLGFDGITGQEGASVGKLGFTCATNTTEFKGQGVDYFVDTRYNYVGQPQIISARYIIEGKDDEGNPMKIYVENNGTDDSGHNANVQTEPFIITDNPKWAWIETAPLHGTHSDVALQIFFWTVEGEDEQQPTGDVESLSDDEEQQDLGNEVEVPEVTEDSELSDDEEKEKLPQLPEQPEQPEQPKEIDLTKYTKEVFAVNLVETQKYSVEGTTCSVEMIYIEGSCAGEFFNGDLIFKDSSAVVKRFKDGRIESTARYYVEGKDDKDNAGHLHFEDNLLGYDAEKRPITVPTIITDLENLAWLQTADIVGIMEKTNEGRLVHYMWNENGKKPYPIAKYPDESKNYSKKVFAVDVIPGGLGFDGFQGVEGTAIGKYGFTCFANNTVFQGQGVDYFVDTRYTFSGQPQSLSARYIMEGKDEDGNPMKIYVENNGLDDNGDNQNVRTEPLIITDNPKWAWIETAPLHGNMTMVGGIQILFWTVEDIDLN